MLLYLKHRKERGRTVLWALFVPSPCRTDAACKAGTETQIPNQHTPGNYGDNNRTQQNEKHPAVTR